MAIAETGGFQPIDYTNAVKTEEYVDKSILGKDDFMKLLLVELQHQDPTEPMDSEKILSQTSQLATLEASENTTNALESLAKSLGSAQQFSNVAAIGRTADLGGDAISFSAQEGDSTFEVYFPTPASSGEVEIKDADDNVVGTIEVPEGTVGVQQFTWDGIKQGGNIVDDGLYKVSANYLDPSSTQRTTKLGVYPIESVRFEGDKTLVKVGSSYVPLDDIVEVY